MRNIYKYTIFIVTISLCIASCTTQAPLIEETAAIEKESSIDETTQEVLPAPPEEEEVKPAEIVVETSQESLDKEELEKAETDISKLIEELNAIIVSKDFTSWKEHLSTDYINYYSDPEVLKERSQSPLLTKYKIVLRTIEDYFNFVVVGSRQNVKLDEIKVINRYRIIAYMFIGDKPVIIYELERIDNIWKIGKF